MKRRESICALMALGMTAPLGCLAQSSTSIVRIGILSSETASGDAVRIEAIRTGLREFGYVDGQNTIIEIRSANGRYDQLPNLAAELLRLKVHVLITAGTKAALAAKQATSSVPIVMASSGDIVGLRLVDSLARPGGNVTGSTNVGRELGAKRLELLRELVPRLKQVAYLVNPENPAFGPNLQALWTTARKLEIDVVPLEVRDLANMADVMSQMEKRAIRAFVLQDETSFSANAKFIAGLAAKSNLLSAGFRHYAEAGGLLGYGPNVRLLERRAGYFVDRILKGATPGDLPIEQPKKYELVLNRATARLLRVPLPQALLVRADQIIG